MEKDSLIYIDDILESMDIIDKYIKGVSIELFKNDIGVQDKVIRRLMIIGEASTRLTKEFKNQFPDIPWRQIIGLRNIIIHEYSSVSLKQIWQIITKDLPSTKPKIEEIKKLLSK